MPVKKMGPDRPMFFRTVDQRSNDNCKAGDIGAAETERKRRCACGILTRVEQLGEISFSCCNRTAVWWCDEKHVDLQVDRPLFRLPVGPYYGSQHRRPGAFNDTVTNVTDTCSCIVIFLQVHMLFFRCTHFHTPELLL